MRVIAVLLFLFASTSWAEGWYVGGSVGKSKASGACSTAPSHPEYSCDEHDTAYGLFVGRQVNETFALELGFVDFGDSDTTGSVVKNYSGNAILPPAGSTRTRYPASSTWSAKGVEAVGLARVPLSTNVDFLVRAGVLFYEAKFNSSIPANPAPYTNSGTSLTIGAGVGFRATKSVEFRAQWQRYFDVDIANVNVISAAALYRF